MCIDELLAASQTIGSPHCRLIPRKPHPYGHLFYLLGDHVGSAYFIFDIFVDVDREASSATIAAQTMLKRSLIGGEHPLHRSVLIILDAAFNTHDLLSFFFDLEISLCLFWTTTGN